jgi:type I restriction enzyme M protein
MLSAMPAGKRINSRQGTLDVGRAATTQTTRARLAAIIKSARDIMRKDAGLNGDLDRLPQLSWLLFLRAFDALEAKHEVEQGPDYRPALEPPFRWRDWGADPDKPTGDTLLKFVNDQLLPYLRELRGDRDDDPRLVLSAVFKEIHNRMQSGYLLRDLVNQIHQINFTSSDDIHTMAFLYEGILKEMRDAAGDSGEFYTPRPVIRFMVEQSFLTLGDSILDPACGTGGFLVEAWEKLHPLVRTKAEKQLLTANLRGIEKKSLPYLLCMMNLILHGVDDPHVVRGNALVRMRNDVSPRTKVKVVLTNPPFGGEEEDSVSKRFPAGLQTKETSWLFLYAVIDRLKDDGRCAIVLPNGALFGGGVGARIKRKLLTECDLHTVVRLPQGLFAPYTQIPSNLLFFDKGRPTKYVWYYEQPLPEGRRGYSKTKPLRYEEFADCQAWWGGLDRKGREENVHAWRVPVADLEANEWNLDLVNPNGTDDLAHHDPTELVADLIKTEQEILGLLSSLQKELDAGA